MVNTVAIRGHDGNVGRHVLPHLIKAHQQGLIRLVILHRPSSDTSKLPSNIELRVIDTDTEEGRKQLPKQLAGVNALIAALGVQGLATQIPLLEAVSNSPEFVTFFPSEYGAPWTAEMLSKPSMKAFSAPFDHAADRAKELGVGVTRIKAGLLPNFLVMEGLVGVYPKENKIQLYKDALNQPFHVSAYEHLGALIAQLAIKPLDQIKNKTYYGYSHSPTGQEIVDFLKSINGTGPKIETYSEDDYAKDTDEMGLTMVAATYRKRWGEGEWGWKEAKAEWVDVDVPLPSFEDLARASMGN